MHNLHTPVVDLSRTTGSGKPNPATGGWFLPMLGGFALGVPVGAIITARAVNKGLQFVGYYIETHTTPEEKKLIADWMNKQAEEIKPHPNHPSNHPNQDPAQTDQASGPWAPFLAVGGVMLGGRGRYRGARAYFDLMPPQRQRELWGKYARFWEKLIRRSRG